MDDDEAIALIASVKGLGVWTAEIYLLFALQRLDVFPAGDIALAAAAADLKRLPARPDPKGVAGAGGDLAAGSFAGGAIVVASLAASDGTARAGRFHLGRGSPDGQRNPRGWPSNGRLSDERRLTVARQAVDGRGRGVREPAP